eukprot:m.184626 g.184626  ORF g.184626 m.184626 type:complete len:564 (-) comp16673_c0_seq1:621-2312(-)
MADESDVSSTIDDIDSRSRSDQEDVEDEADDDMSVDVEDETNDTDNADNADNTDKVEEDNANDDVDEDRFLESFIEEADVADGFVEVTTSSRRRPVSLSAEHQDAEDDDLAAKAAEPTSPHVSVLSNFSLTVLVSTISTASSTATAYVWSWREFASDVAAEMKSPTRPVTMQVKSKGPDLNRHLLVNNFKRLRKALEPFFVLKETIMKICHWENPFISAGALAAYTLCATMNLILPSIFGALLAFLLVQYVRQKQHPNQRQPVDEENDRGLLEKARLFKEILCKVQNQVGCVADTLERVQNLLLWKSPEHSFRFTSIIAVIFFGVFLLPQWIWMSALKIYLGIRVFIQPGLFHNYPRLAEKYDGRKFFSTLPTNADLNRKRIPRYSGQVRARLSQTMGTSHSSANSVGRSTDSGRDESPSRARSESLKKTHERAEGDSLSELGVPVSEEIIETNTCVYIPEGHLTKLRRGRLYVTDTCFCFVSSSRDNSSFCFHLSRLTKLERTGKIIGSKGLMVQLTFKDATGNLVVKTLSGVLNPTALINAISKQQRLVAEQTGGPVVQQS